MGEVREWTGEVMEEWTVQISHNKGGVMINSRGTDVDEVYSNYEKTMSLVEGDNKKIEADEPFYGDGKDMIEPYTKRDGSTGYRIGKGGSPGNCPICKGSNFQYGKSSFGAYYSCEDCAKLGNQTFINMKEK